ncbi:MAG TPA: D-glycero-beta-D-manno-heptose-7-phosphate kinase [Vicinamibacterales bacterium]|nr:D-glycero-beta-D-manno-heptose-7-phosphate kinase [Vicinamibacterales bacterium]
MTVRHMELTRLSRDQARLLIDRFRGVPLLVVGDLMLDRFVVGRVERISPEAPVPVVQFRSEHARLGGAANVAHNAIALGGTVSLVGLVGMDGAAAHVRDSLRSIGANVEGLIVDPDRPTIEKVRIVTERNQQVARIDYENDADISGTLEQAVADRASELGARTQGLVASDYAKGTVSRRVITALTGLGALPLVVDPKVRHISYYQGATVITPNHHEAEQATGIRIRTAEDASAAAREFRRLAGCKSVLVTRGEHGMWLLDEAAEGGIPTVAREVADVTGAGDTVVAALALALASGATMAEAAVLANHAAGIVVGKFGAATVTAEELIETFQATD